MVVDGLSVVPRRTCHHTSVLVIIFIACCAVYDTHRVGCSTFQLEEVPCIVTRVIRARCDTTHCCEVEHETRWACTHTSPHGSSNSSCALIEEQSEVVACCGAFHEIWNGIIPTSAALDASTIIVDDIIVVSIEIRSRAVDGRWVHTCRCEGITIIASIGGGGGVTIVAASLASCCTTDYIIIVAARITNAFAVFHSLSRIRTARTLGSTWTCTACTITVTTEHGEIGTLNTPIVVEPG